MLVTGWDLPIEGQVNWLIDVDDNLRVDADRENMFRILSNLVRNAMQALEGHDETNVGEIRVAARRDGRKVIIEISDDGPGLPPKAREHLFEAFQGSTRQGGTGLGLAIAAELIAAHGGRIDLLDTDKGATFAIEIPDRAAR